MHLLLAANRQPARYTWQTVQSYPQFINNRSVRLLSVKP